MTERERDCEKNREIHREKETDCEIEKERGGEIVKRERYLKKRDRDTLCKK